MPIRYLAAGQARAVAAMRLDDARTLLRAGLAKGGAPARLNGSVYLAGYAVECWLKALLIDAHPELARPAEGPEDDDLRRRRQLVYGTHDLELLIAWTPQADHRLSRTGNRRLPAMLRQLAERWDVRDRYATAPVDREEAADFIGRVEELGSWLT